MAAVDLKGKVAIVTGATKGIGRAIAKALAEAGASVVGTARNADPAAQFTKEIEDIGGTFLFIQADVAKWNDCARTVQTALERCGHVDILINNAGTSLPQVRLNEIEEADWRAVAGVTLEGTLFMSRAVLPGMIAQKDGVILNVASTAGVQTAASMGAYAACKAAVIQLARVIAVENLENGVRANALLVGATDTELVRTAFRALGTQGASGGGEDGAGFPLGPMLLKPEGIGSAVTLLCSDAAREINGGTINLDRALLAGWGHQTLMQAALTGLLTIP